MQLHETCQSWFVWYHTWVVIVTDFTSSFLSIYRCTISLHASPKAINASLKARSNYKYTISLEASLKPMSPQSRSRSIYKYTISLEASLKPMSPQNRSRSNPLMRARRKKNAAMQFKWWLALSCINVINVSSFSTKCTKIRLFIHTVHVSLLFFINSYFINKAVSFSYLNYFTFHVKAFYGRLNYSTVFSLPNSYLIP